MRTPSRRMPASPRQELSLPKTAALLALVTLPVIILTVANVNLIVGGILIGLITVIFIFAHVARWKRLADLTADRPGESVCTFARSFGRRAVDTWVIRAVHEELQPYCRAGSVTLPLRASDHLEDVLGIDGEELDDIAGVIALRTGRPLEAHEQNPYYGKVVTVNDLVMFFENQPVTR